VTDTIKLSDLHIDKMNVRGAAKAEPDFIANIAARGVEQKLVVRPNGTGFGVVDGGKRLSALQALLAGGKIKADHPVPVDLRKGMTDAEARELSLTLNIVRADMHPVDKYRAFVQLNHDKTKPIDVDKLAARFGIERKEMDKIIALGGLSDVVLDAWRSDRISAAGAKVFTLCPSKKAQEIVFAKVDKRSAKDRQIEDWPIKQELKIGHNNPGPPAVGDRRSRIRQARRQGDARSVRHQSHCQRSQAADGDGAGKDRRNLQDADRTGLVLGDQRRAEQQLFLRHDPTGATTPPTSRNWRR
jgi:ParB-like chromosome segregation protein Spo0J